MDTRTFARSRLCVIHTLLDVFRDDRVMGLAVEPLAAVIDPANELEGDHVLRVCFKAHTRGNQYIGGVFELYFYMIQCRSVNDDELIDIAANMRGQYEQYVQHIRAMSDEQIEQNTQRGSPTALTPRIQASKRRARKRSSKTTRH